MLKFNEKTMKKAVVAEEFAVEDDNFCISRNGGGDSVMAKPGMELWVLSEAECESYGSVEMSLCWIPKFGFATTLASKFVDYIATETPEEREALDMIDTTSKKVESLASDSELTDGSEWKNGDKCVIKNPEGLGVWDEANKYLGTTGTVMAVFTNTNGLKVAAVSHDDKTCICWMLSMLEKPESPEEKAERERLDLVKKACLTVRHDYGLMSESDRNFLEKAGLEWLKAFEREGYRKEQK